LSAFIFFACAVLAQWGSHRLSIFVIVQAFRIVTALPVVLLRTASKQLQEGYKAARNRLSSGGGGRTSSFSDREGSRSASFDSASSGMKVHSRHSEDYLIPEEHSHEMDEDGPDFGIVPEVAPYTPSLCDDGSQQHMHSPKRQFPGFFATPKAHTKSRVSMTPSRVSRFFHRNSSTGTTRSTTEPSSLQSRTSQSEELDEGEGGLSHLLSPQFSDTGSSISQHITSMLHSSFSSLKTGGAQSDEHGASPASPTSDHDAPTPTSKVP